MLRQQPWILESARRRRTVGNGAMGNARWRGVPLKAVLAKAGVQAGAKQVTFDGLDGPVMRQDA